MEKKIKIKNKKKKKKKKKKKRKKKLKMANKKATRATPKKPQASKRKYIENMVVFYQ